MEQSRVYSALHVSALIVVVIIIYTTMKYYFCSFFLRVHETLVLFISLSLRLFHFIRFTFIACYLVIFLPLHIDTTLSYRIISIKFRKECSSTLIIILMTY